MSATKKTVTVEQIKERDSKRFGRHIPGRVADGHKATIVLGESITLHGVDRGLAYSKTFKIGDTAAYHSYNFVYTGEIVAIGEKTITIKDHDTVTRLALYSFDWRNFDLDLESIAARNHETMMTI